MLDEPQVVVVVSEEMKARAALAYRLQFPAWAGTHADRVESLAA